MPNSATKKSGGPTAKASLNNKKATKKRVETPPSADLRLPKEPDPYSYFMQTHLPSLQQFQTHGSGTFELFKMAADKSDDLEVGNDLLQRWQSEYNWKWTQPASFYQQLFKDKTGKRPIEERIDELFREHDGNWESVFRFLVNILDIDNIEKIPDPFSWSMRSLAIAISQRDPFSFFSINLIQSMPEENLNSLYWHQGEREGLELRSFPCAGFWAMTQMILGSPWTTPFNDDVGTEDQIEFFSPAITNQLATAYATYENSKLGDDEPMFQVPTAKSISESPTQGPSQQASPGIVFGQSPSLPARVILQTSAAASTPSRTEDEAISDITGGTGIDNDTGSRPTIAGTSDITGVAGFDNQTGSRLPSAGISSGAGGIASDMALQSSPSPARLSTGDTPNGQLQLFNIQQSAASPAGPPTTLTTGGQLQLFPLPNQTAMAVDSPQVKRLPFTIEEKMSSMTGIDMAGMDGLDAHLFDCNWEKHFDGAQGGDNNLTSFWVEHFADSMYDALENSEHGLILLPIDDSNYKNKNLWIRSAAEVRQRITTYRDMTMYCDPNYGNFPYFLSNHSTGAKKLRSRIRVAYILGLHSDIIKCYLHMGFRPQGRGAGCFDSPLQYCPIDKAGWCAFWPEDLNILAFTKEIMRYLEWKYPVGLKWDWVTMPYVASRSKFNDKSPGLQQYHIYARRCDVKIIDQLCRAWLVPTTPRADLPWCFPVHYVHDWRSAQQGNLSVRPHGIVKALVQDMALKAKDFIELTTVIYPSSSLPGLLRKTATRNFGVTSLFKLLLHTKCTPAQVDTAAAAPDLAQPPPSPDSPGGVDVAGFRKVAKKRKKKKKSDSKDPIDLTIMSLAELHEQQLTPAQAKAYQELERKRQKDMANKRPAGLIIGMVPGEFVGTFVIIIRNKFAPLGRNVFIGGLEAFLTHHLAEMNDTVADVIMKKWISSADVERSRRRNLIWDIAELRARESTVANGGVDEALQFLDGFGPDPMDVFDGTLEIDLNMIRERDVDDGATVAGALDELREAETHLEHAFLEIELKDARLDLQDVALQAAERTALELQQSNEDLLAQLKWERQKANTPALVPVALALKYPPTGALALKSPPTYSQAAASVPAGTDESNSLMQSDGEDGEPAPMDNDSAEPSLSDSDPMVPATEDCKPPAIEARASVDTPATLLPSPPALPDPASQARPSSTSASVSPWTQALARTAPATAPVLRTPPRMPQQQREVTSNGSNPSPPLPQPSEMASTVTPVAASVSSEATSNAGSSARTTPTRSSQLTIESFFTPPPKKKNKQVSISTETTTISSQPADSSPSRDSSPVAAAK